MWHDYPFSQRNKTKKEQAVEIEAWGGGEGGGGEGGGRGLVEKTWKLKKSTLSHRILKLAVS